MALFKTLWGWVKIIPWFFKWVYQNIIRKPVEQNTITRDEILAHVEGNTRVRNQARKHLAREEESIRAENKANRKKVLKKKRQKNARKKQRK